LAKEEEQKPTCWDRLCRKRARKEDARKEVTKKEDETELTPQLQKASSQGVEMVKKVFFPAMPALLQDLWVYLELSISMFAFIFGLVTFSTGTGTQRIFKIVYLVLASIGVILSLFDAFIFIFYVSHLTKLIRKYLKSWRQRHHQRNIEQDGEGGENNEEQRKWCRCPPQLPEKWLTRFNQFFELGRNLLSELLLYPLLICDLFDFIALGGAAPKNAEDRTNFVLFFVGSFYLVLAVYVMRVVTIVGTMVSMLRLPLQATGGQKQYMRIMVRFCFHALRQILVHLLIILAVAAKIRNEDPEILDDADPINISPFLWCAMFLGWLIPLAGVLTFFVVNYYWAKEFSISFWVDMISLLQGQSFADVVFSGEGMSATKETAKQVAEEVETKTVTVVSPEAKQKTLDFVEKSQLNEVKRQLKRFKSPSFLTKFFHPLKLPLLSLSGLFYDACLVAFIVTLALTYDSENRVRVAISNDTFLLTMFVLVIIFILLANFHLLIWVNIGLSIMLVVSIAAAVYILVAIPFFIFVYIPVASIIGYWQCWINFTKATEVFHVPGEKPKHMDLELTKLMIQQRTQLYREHNELLLGCNDLELTNEKKEET